MPVVQDDFVYRPCRSCFLAFMNVDMVVNRWRFHSNPSVQNLVPMFWTLFFIGTTMTFACPLSVVAAPLGEAVSADGQCRAVLSLSPDHPTLADTVTLTLDVSCPDGETVEFPPFGERLGELNIVDINKTTNRQLVLTAIPQHVGKTPIWAMTVQCGQQQIELPAVELNITASIDSENASLDDIGLAAEPIPATFWYIYAALAVLVLAVLFLLWLFYRRKRTEVPKEIPPLSAQELALRRLSALLESRKHEADVKGFFVELSDIVRWYVERLTGIRAPELTTEEFLHRIAEPARWYGSGGEQPARSTGSLDTLVPFLEAADSVKFAKHVPASDEIMLAFRRAENFIRRSQE